MKARIDGRDVRYEISGQGPWLTLSHALGTDLSLWEPQLAALEPHFTVLRYDIRGHGPAGVQDVIAPLMLDDLARDAAALLCHLDVAHTHWLGLSLGGMIGQMLALSRPA